MKLEKIHIYWNFIQIFTFNLLLIIILNRLNVYSELILVFYGIFGLNILIGIITLPYYLIKKFNFSYISLSILDVSPLFLFLFDYVFSKVTGTYLSDSLLMILWIFEEFLLLITIILDLYLFFEMKNKFDELKDKWGERKQIEKPISFKQVVKPDRLKFVLTLILIIVSIFLYIIISFYITHFMKCVTPDIVVQKLRRNAIFEFDFEIFNCAKIGLPLSFINFVEFMGKIVKNELICTNIFCNFEFYINFVNKNFSIMIYYYNLIIDIIFWYFLSCLIIWIYDKVKKRK